MTKEEKIKRLNNLYSDYEVMEIIGYYDGSNEDVAILETLEEGSEEFYDKLYELAIENGNFEEAIETNQRYAL